MAIPEGITAEHIQKAMDNIRKMKFDIKYKSKKYCLEADDRHFPSKHIIARAHEVFAGSFLGSEEFEGGDQTKKFLRDRGFTVVTCRCGGGYYD